MKHPRSHQPQGVALIVVLAFIVLLSIFIVSFFTSSQNELGAAQSYSGEVSAQQLSESVVSMVEGQIREATSRANGAWGSQPGMIRVYRDRGSASTKAEAFFKLYSSDDMIVSGADLGSFQTGQGMDPSNTSSLPTDLDLAWRTKPALFTDLNEPVIVNTGLPSPSPTTAARFPIIDGNGMATLRVNNKPVTTYTSVNSTGKTVPTVEGFGITPGFSPFNAAKPLSSTNTPVPMPVKWLYMLKDGTLTAPTGLGTDGTQVVWTGSAVGPTLTNPIVGRVAFWTDDECCKVNINTAGGFSDKDIGALKPTAYTDDDYAGSYWDTPRVLTNFDRGIEFSSTNPNIKKGGLGISQPVRGEFQRYPGHPSTTSLGLVLQNFLTSEQFYDITPRLHSGATQNGTTRFLAAYDDPVPYRARRLYTSVDEMFYAQPDVQPASGMPRTTQDAWLKTRPAPETLTTSSAITPDLLQRLRFFLSAHSRAPELNLFGRPRVTIWPVRAAADVASEQSAKTDKTDVFSYWNASDRLISFCSTIGPSDPTKETTVTKRFLFQRKDAYSPTTDYSGIPRNQDLMNYLKSVTSLQIPGYANAAAPKGFLSKFANADPKGDTTARDQVLTEIFDYIRTVNLRDSTNDKLIGKVITDYETPGNLDNYWLKFKPSDEILREKYKYAPRGLVVPITIGKTLGLGRFPTVSEAALVLYHAGYAGDDGKFHSDPDEVTDDPAVVAQKNNTKTLVKSDYVRAFVIFEMFNPMQGFGPTTTPDANSPEKRAIIIEVDGLNQFSINGTALGFPSKNAHNAYNHTSGAGWFGRNSGGSEGFVHTLIGPIVPTGMVTNNKWGTGGPGTANWYEFQSWLPQGGAASTSGVSANGVKVDRVIDPATKLRKFQPTVQLSAATVAVRLKYGKADASDAASVPTIHAITLNFPAASVPMPTDQIWADVAQVMMYNTYPNPYAMGGQGRDWVGGSAYYDAGGFRSPHVFPANADQKVAKANNEALRVKLAGNPNWVSCAQPSGADIGKLQSGPKQFGTRLRDASRWGGIFSAAQGQWSWNSSSDANANANHYHGYDDRNRWRQLLQPGDTVRSVLFTNGDLRTASITADSSASYKPHPDYQSSTVRHAQTLRVAGGSISEPGAALYYPPYKTYPTDTRDPIANQSPKYRTETTFGNLVQLKPAGNSYPPLRTPDVPPGVNGVTQATGIWGDFDTGIGDQSDGAFANKADEGNLIYRYKNFWWDENGQKHWDQIGTAANFPLWSYPIPYYTFAYEETFDTFFTPNRQVPSPVVFGSLPAGKNANWQTLSFSPNPAGGDSHPGRDLNKGPKDYLLLDLFTMPVVEPYAISEPFSTAGKVNMNYQIVPFHYINRSTGMRAVLQSARVTAFPAADVQTYKTVLNPRSTAIGSDPNYRYVVDRDQTLAAFEDLNSGYFAQYKNSPDLGFFKTAAEICDFFLYPKSLKPILLPTWTANDAKIKNNFWGLGNNPPQTANTLTGDNMREKPYGDLYPRLTAKSNTFTVHMRVQALRQTPADAGKQVWDEKRDRVIGEYRGSATIERYIDPDDRRFDNTNSVTSSRGDWIDVDNASVEPAYRFRVVNTKRFVP